jgi:hypothetical protein
MALITMKSASATIANSNTVWMNMPYLKSTG